MQNYIDCSLCCFEKASIISSCGCLYCNTCFHESQSYICINQTKCLNCQNSIDYFKFIDITNNDIISQLKGWNIYPQKNNDIIEKIKVYIFFINLAFQ